MKFGHFAEKQPYCTPEKTVHARWYCLVHNVITKHLPLLL